VLIELAMVFCQLEDPLEVLDLLGGSSGGQLSVKTELNEPLTMLVSNLLHVDVTYARDEVVHRPCGLLERSGTHLSFRARKTIPKEVRELHRNRIGNVHPQLQFLLIPLAFGLAFVCMAERDLPSLAVLVYVIEHVPK
jgi:hypothetical protein